MLSKELLARTMGFSPPRVRRLVFNPMLRPHWIPGCDKFWYRRESPEGVAVTVVDAADGTKTAAFDHAALAGALTAAGVPAEPGALPLEDLQIDAAGTARFRAGGRNFLWNGAGLQDGPRYQPELPGEVRSPDGAWAAFRRDDDLWVRSVTSGRERRLTSDGAAHHAYAKSPDSNLTTVTLARRRIVLPAGVLWSPDSRRLLTYRLDERQVQVYPLVQHVPDDGSVRPVLHCLRVPHSGDAALPTEAHLVIDIADGTPIPAQAPPSVVGVMSAIEKEEAWWSADSSRAYVLDRNRTSSRLTLREIDAATGAVRDVVSETAPTFLEVNLSVTGLPNIRVLDASGEVIWFSQRDGFAHLYLYDLRTGALKNRITAGEWVVRDIVHVDAAARRVYFLAGGVDPAIDPYLCTLCSVGLDGSGFTVLTPEPQDHALATPRKRVPRDHIRAEGDIGEWRSPSGRYFVHTHSTIETLPVSTLRRADGSLVAVIEEAALDPALAASWRWPQAFDAIAADARTKLFGAMWLPADFDPAKKYPVIDYIYPGPQRGQTPSVMLTDVMGDLGRACLPMMFAALGFVVVNVDGRGTPLRGKSFHDESYGKLDDPGMLADHVTVLEQLGARHGFIDLSRVGIMGHSGGGYASVRALLEYPKIFHAAVATSGNHDQRGYSYSWCEKYMGELVRDAAGRSNFDSAANPPLAHRLEGKLLLGYGEMDDNVHPALTLQLIAALIAADKDFDLIVLPNDDHTTVWGNPYFLRRAMAFLLTHLG